MGRLKKFIPEILGVIFFTIWGYVNKFQYIQEQNLTTMIKIYGIGFCVFLLLGFASYKFISRISTKKAIIASLIVALIAPIAIVGFFGLTEQQSVVATVYLIITMMFSFRQKIIHSFISLKCIQK